MNETDARAIAAILGLGGEPWHSGGGIWLVRYVRPDGTLVFISEEGVAAYADMDAFHYGEELRTIDLR